MLFLLISEYSNVYPKVAELNGSDLGELFVRECGMIVRPLEIMGLRSGESREFLATLLGTWAWTPGRLRSLYVR